MPPAKPKSYFVLLKMIDLYFIVVKFRETISTVNYYCLFMNDPKLESSKKKKSDETLRPCDPRLISPLRSTDLVTFLLIFV